MKGVHSFSLGLIIILVTESSCNTDNSSGRLDPNVEPIVEGSWHRLAASTTWQMQLLSNESNGINTTYDVDVYDIDLFDNTEGGIDSLKKQGRKVICYFSAGSYEDWRSDKDEFASSVLGNTLKGWEGERWLDIRQNNVLDIMLKRLDLAVEKGCDGVDPDNMNGYINDSGFSLLAEDQLAYNKFIANEAHGRGLTVGLKNDGDQAEELVGYYDFSLNEQCHEFNECAQLLVFTQNNKPIFNAEYRDSLQEAEALAQTLCPKAQSENIRTIIFPLMLDDTYRLSCESTNP